jgi:hypothetical protein
VAAVARRYLCERFVRPVLGGLACQDIRVADMQAVLNAAPALRLDLRTETAWLVTVSLAFARLCRDGEAGTRRGSREPAGRPGALNGKRSHTAPLNAWSLY